LILLALGAAVVSLVISSAQWLLLVSAALVLFAFYLSRRQPAPTTSDNPIDESLTSRVSELPPGPVDQQVPDGEQLRDVASSTETADHDDAGHRDDRDLADHDRGGRRPPNVRPQSGHAIAS
jgi:hypothetical protein